VTARYQGVKFSLLPNLFQYQIPRRCFAFYGLQAPLPTDLIRFHMANHLTQLAPPLGSHNNVIARIDLFALASSSKVVQFPQWLETYSNYR
jgi:hypothetical protein